MKAVFGALVMFLAGFWLAVAAAVAAESGRQAPGPEDLLDKGQALARAGKKEEAAKLFKQAAGKFEASLKTATEDAQVNYLLGKAHYLLRQPGKALAYTEKAVELAPAKAAYHFLNGCVLQMMNKAEASGKEFLATVKLEPKHVNAWFELGHFYHYHQQPDLTKALDAYKQAADADPQHFAAIGFAGLVLYKTGKKDDALKYFKRAKQLRPDFELATYFSGLIYQEQKKYDQALAQFGALLAFDPANHLALAHQIQVYEAQADLEKREAARRSIYQLWKSGKSGRLSKTGFYQRDRFATDKHYVEAFEHFELKGKMALKYVYMVFEPKTRKHLFRISLGSYESTNAMLRARTEKGKKEVRLYHLDGYFTWGHATYGFFEGEPSYDKIKQKVIAILKGADSALSTSSFGPSINPKPDPKPESPKPK